jgi:hypothetical protein
MSADLTGTVNSLLTTLIYVMIEVVNKCDGVESKGIWRLRITGFVNYVHSPEF